MRLCIFFAVLFCGLARANTEKVIFTSQEYGIDPELSPIALAKLTPADGILTTSIAATRGTGNVTWYILDELEAGRRHELRACWSATVCTSRGAQNDV